MHSSHQTVDKRELVFKSSTTQYSSGTAYRKTDETVKKHEHLNIMYFVQQYNRQH